MNNPYHYRPQPSSLRAADDVFRQINATPQWRELFAQGKMLGVLVYSREPLKYICAYSGVVNGLVDPDNFFVPPIYDLQQPDDFYLQKDAEITALNATIASLVLQADATTDKVRRRSLTQQIAMQKQQRRQLSIALQHEIFSHFDFINTKGYYRNVVDIFADARRGLPPGGTGECAAPRLLQYAHQHRLPPLEITEFWYGRSPRVTLRVHGQFYPSCIEKCSPIISYMTEGIDAGRAPEAEPPLPIAQLPIIYEDDHLLLCEKPAGVLSVPGKVTGNSVEAHLHKLYPHVKGPMLVHRLDQSTSGLMLAAKDAQTHRQLQQSFLTHEVRKEYLALLSGHLPCQRGLISLPISPNPDDRPRQTVDFTLGREATTLFEVISNHPTSLTLHTSPHIPLPSSLTLVRFTPLTGRTHQLRLHAASLFGLGLPIVGDRIYGGVPAPRLMLRAQQLTFRHPFTGETMTFRATDEGFDVTQMAGSF